MYKTNQKRERKFLSEYLNIPEDHIEILHGTTTRVSSGRSDCTLYICITAMLPQDDQEYPYEPFQKVTTSVPLIDFIHWCLNNG